MKADWDLILRYLNNESTPAEWKEIEDLLKSDAGFANQFSRIQKVWQSPAEKFPPPDIEAALQNVKAKISKADRGEPSANIYKLNEPELNDNVFQKPFKTYILRAAAVLVIFLTGIYLISKFYSSSEMNTIFVTNIEQQEITLPDGTIVKLDAGSSFQYPENFAVGNRTVFLNGEGYFTVTPNPEKPFVINAGNATVTVLGTAFSLRAWEDYNKTTIAVVEGKVSFKTKNESQDEEVILTKGEMSIIEGDNPPAAPKLAEVSQYTAWLKREINFQSTPLGEVLDQLSRWYGLEFVLPAESFRSDLLNIYIKNEPVENILDIICIMMNFTYERDENRVVFSL